VGGRSLPGVYPTEKPLMSAQRRRLRRASTRSWPRQLHMSRGRGLGEKPESRQYRTTYSGLFICTLLEEQSIQVHVWNSSPWRTCSCRIGGSLKECFLGVLNLCVTVPRQCIIGISCSWPWRLPIGSPSGNGVSGLLPLKDPERCRNWHHAQGAHIMHVRTGHPGEPLLWNGS
jgi:hypothetical protein